MFFCQKQAARFPIPPIQSNTVKARHQNRLVGCQQSCGNQNSTQNSTTRYTYRLHVQVRKPTMQNSTGSQLHVTNKPTPAPPNKKQEKKHKEKTQKQGKKKGKNRKKRCQKKSRKPKRQGKEGQGIPKTLKSASVVVSMTVIYSNKNKSVSATVFQF